MNKKAFYDKLLKLTLPATIQSLMLALVAVADALMPIHIHLQQFDEVFLPLRQHPEVVAVIVLVIVARAAEVLFAGCQHGIVIGYLRKLFEVHKNTSFHRFGLILLYGRIFVLSVTRP